jgi:hypothetical protein
MGAPVNYVAWKHIPTSYLVCSQDKNLLPATQAQCVSRLKDVWKDQVHIEHLDTDHFPFVHMPGKVAEIIATAARGHTHA